MEFLIKPFEKKINCHLADEPFISKEEILKIVGRDVYRSVANIVGLVSLLEENGVNDKDFKDIQHYLTIESKKLDLMVKEICKQTA